MDAFLRGSMVLLNFGTHTWSHVTLQSNIAHPEMNAKSDAAREVIFCDAFQIACRTQLSFMSI